MGNQQQSGMGSNESGQTPAQSGVQSGAMIGQLPQNFSWDRYMQELTTARESLQGYTQQGFQPQGDQNQRLTDAFYCIDQTNQLLQVPEIQTVIQNYIQQQHGSGGSLSQGATASGRSGPGAQGKVQT